MIMKFLKTKVLETRSVVATYTLLQRSLFPGQVCIITTNEFCSAIGFLIGEFVLMFY